MLRRIRGGLAVAATGLAVVLSPLGTKSVARALGIARGHMASALEATDEARLRYISASGSTLYETGRASGTLPGSMKVHMRIAATFSGNFTINAPGGAIVGRGSAIPHGVGVYESFAGRLTVSGGNGRYRHARGKAELYGTFNRNTYALVIQTRGTLRY